MLITGFEPFGGAERNPSAEVVKALDLGAFSDHQLHTAILPVAAARAPQELRDLLADIRPDVVLGLGEARDRKYFDLERIAVNLLDFRHPDNEGALCTDQPVVAGGPAAYWSTLPLKMLNQHLVQLGFPTRLSLSAGSYICNQVFYVSSHWAASHLSGMWVGFLHIPGALPGEASFVFDRQLAYTRQLILHILMLKAHSSNFAKPA